MNPQGHPFVSPWLRSELIASWRETWLVILTFTGFFLASAIVMEINRLRGYPPWLGETNGSTLRLMAHESIMLAAFFAWTRARGWHLSDLRIRRTLMGTIVGILFATLLVGVDVCYTWELYRHGLFPHRHPNPAHHLHKPAELTFVVAVTQTVVNACYEEVLMMGYAFNQFAAKAGPRAALTLVVLLRVGQHLWKDPILLPFTAFHFILAALLYWRTKNLWPLILAHALYDLLFDLPLLRATSI